MYFNFEDYRPDTPTLPRSLTRLEVSLLTVIIYLSTVILLLVWPQLPFVKAWEAERQQQLAEQQEQQLEQQRENARFVFMAPRVDLRRRRSRRSAPSCRTSIVRRGRRNGRKNQPTRCRSRAATRPSGLKRAPPAPERRMRRGPAARSENATSSASRFSNRRRATSPERRKSRRRSRAEPQRG